MEVGTRVGVEHECSLAFIKQHPAWFDEQIRVGDTIAHHIEARTGGMAVATALEHEHVSGSTEPWIVQLVVALLHSLQRDQPNVLELGGFVGHTSAKLALALEAQGGGTLTVAEYDADAPERADLCESSLLAVSVPNVAWRVVRADAIQVVQSLPDNSLDFVFVDDDHSKPHVTEELRALWPKMRTGGLITGHDVFGSCDLQAVFKAFGGYALDLPRLGPAGGLGIIQVRD